jgi:hypothetical protein
VITFAATWEAVSRLPQLPSTPHEVLGLPAETTDAGLIVQAARRRLNAIRDAYGSEGDVKEVLTSIIVAARQAMLAQARAASGGSPR